jgi:hypothetical protein
LGKNLRVEEDGFPAAGQLGCVARLVHDRRREGAALRRDWQRGQGDHVRVAAQEEVLEEDLAREAGVRVVFAAVHLREDRAEERLVPVLRHQVILEAMTLDVEDELLARK